jgi:hypothetical protein
MTMSHTQPPISIRQPPTYFYSLYHHVIGGLFSFTDYPTPKGGGGIFSLFLSFSPKRGGDGNHPVTKTVSTHLAYHQ